MKMVILSVFSLISFSVFADELAIKHLKSGHAQLNLENLGLAVTYGGLTNCNYEEEYVCIPVNYTYSLTKYFYILSSPYIYTYKTSSNQKVIVRCDVNIGYGKYQDFEKALFELGELPADFKSKYTVVASKNASQEEYYENFPNGRKFKLRKKYSNIYVNSSSVNADSGSDTESNYIRLEFTADFNKTQKLYFNCNAKTRGNESVLLTIGVLDKALNNIIVIK